MESRAELEQRGDAPANLDASLRRLDDPGDQLQQRRLAGAVPADEPDRIARLRPHGYSAQRPDVLAAAPAARHDQLLESSRLLRVDTEPTRDLVDADLAWVDHALDGSETACCTSPARTSMNAGSAFGISIRRNSRPRSRERSAASKSRSHRISRWSATKPIGHASTSCTPSRASVSRCSRMSGPSH